MTAGTLQGVSGSTDLIKVEVVTAVLGQGIGSDKVLSVVAPGWRILVWMQVTLTQEIFWLLPALA